MSVRVRPKAGTLWVTATANGRGTLTCDVPSADASYRPVLDEPVTLTLDGVRIFGGYITSVLEHGIGQNPVGIFSTITAIDYNQLADERYALAVYAAGTTLKEALEALVGWVPGVTVSGTQATGPVLPDLTYDYVRVSDILDELSDLTSYIWNIDYYGVLSMIAPGAVAAPFDIAAGDGNVIGDVTVEPTRHEYANRVIVRAGTITATANDVAEQTTGFGRVKEVVAIAPPDTTQEAADAMAAGILARTTPTLKTVRYKTHVAGLVPGMTQSINLPTRNINNTFLITDVQTRDLGRDILERTVTAIEGLVYQTGWRQTFQKWSGSVATVAGMNVGSPSSLRRFAYTLASGVDAVSSPTPDWVPASPTQVQINTIARGTPDASVIVRLRALTAGVSVRARIFDVSDNVACAGTSSLVTSTSWTLVAFTATLTAGSHLYRLELLPSAANEAVMAAGYLE